jgi:integrase
MIKDWKLAMEKRDLGITTKRNVFADFKGLLNYAVRMEYIPVNLLSKAGNFKDNSTTIKPGMDFYTASEYKLFDKAAKEIAMKKQADNHDLFEWNYYVFFSIAFYTGLRKGEIHALRWSDINGAFLSVKRSITQKLKGEDRETMPKNKSSIRTLQMPLPLIEILNEHKKRQGLLPRLNADCRVCGVDRCLRDSTVENRNKLYAETAGLKKIRIHDFRHSHVSVLASEKINIQEIARRLGHSKIEMTWNTYSHLYPHEEERAVSILNLVA